MGLRAPKMCLVVDDEEPVRAYVKSILERENYRTTEANNGVEGLRIVKKLADALDIIVSDIRMPGGDGLTFATTVRESFPTVPIVLMSGDADAIGKGIQVLVSSSYRSHFNAMHCFWLYKTLRK